MSAVPETVAPSSNDATAPSPDTTAPSPDATASFPNTTAPCPDATAASSRATAPSPDAEAPFPDADAPSPPPLTEAAAEAARRGVVYLSRVPPGLKPSALREMLSPFGTVERTYLRAESDAARSARLRGGGSRRSRYVDGWVEFSRKRHARRVVDLLNGQPMGTKKRSRFHDDLWCLRYLRGFRWEHLNESGGDARRERTNRVRAEVAAGRREKAFYLAQADTAKGLEGMARKKRRRAEAAAGGGDAAGAAGGPASAAGAAAPDGAAVSAGGSGDGAGGPASSAGELFQPRVVRRFRQKTVLRLDQDDGESGEE
ncbi:hypothetical protein MMPV_002818 [Pyropia vietnamensis]